MIDDDEPVLTDDDRDLWAAWSETSCLWARGSVHAHRVDEARRAIADMQERAPRAYIAWSGGKDSTAMAHLAAGLGVRVAMSVKDDLDFPGEEEYLRVLAAQWGIRLDIERPAFSLQSWLVEHPGLDASDDMHGRATAFSEAAFYSLIDAYRDRHGCPGVYLGLRGEESRGRKMNLATRGLVYEKCGGEIVCQPLARWRGIDVFAYLLSRDIPVLPLYRCVALRREPDRIRKSWWLPGADSKRGGMIWLRTYWPSLYGRLCEIMPSARGWG